MKESFKEAMLELAYAVGLFLLTLLIMLFIFLFGGALVKWVGN